MANVVSLDGAINWAQRLIESEPVWLDDYSGVEAADCLRVILAEVERLSTPLDDATIEHYERQFTKVYDTDDWQYQLAVALVAEIRRLKDRPAIEASTPDAEKAFNDWFESHWSEYGMPRVLAKGAWNARGDFEAERVRSLARSAASLQPLRGSRSVTHYPGCENEHHACALAKLKASRDSVERLTRQYEKAANIRWDDGLLPGGYVCADCGQPVDSEPCPEHSPRVPSHE